MFFKYVWQKADALFFIKGRLYFHHVSGECAKSNGGAPSVLVAFGSSNAECLKNVDLRPNELIHKAYDKDEWTPLLNRIVSAKGRIGHDKEEDFILSTI